jgi:arginyl-tRNA synthetase
MNIASLLQQRLADALTQMQCSAESVKKYSEMVRPAQGDRFGDYQANCAMPFAKELRRKPPEIAREIVAKMWIDDICESPEIAGPGFINLKIRREFLAKNMQALSTDERLGVAPTRKPRRFVIDYSSPNVAKPLHVGHLRSTIIGDSLTRLLRFLGHTVITDNHLGDWGTQFGMLLYGYKHFRDDAALAADPVREMVRLYLEVRRLTRGTEEEQGEVTLTPEEASITEACRQETAKLQAGDPENVALWQKFMPWCMGAIEPIYKRLDVRFDHAHGESFYNPMMPAVVDDLIAKGIAVSSKDALVVFTDENPDGPVAVIRKRDGAFTYMTSDLATIRYRMAEFQPDAILYVVGSPQSFHFKQLFATARRWDYPNVEFQHIAFGSVLGSDNKVLSTRNGGAAELSELLDMAVQHGADRYKQSRQERVARSEPVPEVSEKEQMSIAETVGLGAVRYADLSQNRLSDYRFDWSKMLATDGNSATYMQYAYARCRSIFSKGSHSPEAIRAMSPLPDLQTAFEQSLALQILRFEEALDAAAQEYLPHALTSYLWDFAKTYSSFFVNCPVLRAETAETRDGRLLLCDLTARTIRLTLELLGIRTIERM